MHMHIQLTEVACTYVAFKNPNFSAVADKDQRELLLPIAQIAHVNFLHNFMQRLDMCAEAHQVQPLHVQKACCWLPGPPDASVSLRACGSP